jgi:phage FluMu gp28-like protein
MAGFAADMTKGVKSTHALHTPAAHALPEAGPAGLLKEKQRFADLDLLLKYQASLFDSVSHYALLAIEKSRRIGYTWAAAALAALTAGATKDAGGMDVLYLGPSLDMAREFIDTCAQWALLFHEAIGTCTEVEPCELFDDGDNPDKAIKAFRISFASGKEIMALTSKPRSLRGRQGLVIIDEAAFHDDLDEVLKAALALLMWGGRVIVISTHNGDKNPFNLLIGDIRSGKRDGGVIRVTLEDALRDGLYRRICMVTGEVWSLEAEQAWLQKLLGAYGDAANEELHCIPRASGGRWVPRSVLEACQSDIPVLRWSAPKGFVDLPEATRQAELAEWCERHLAPVLEKLNPALMSALGLDFAMLADLTAIVPGQVGRDQVRRPACVVELRECPVDQQRQVLFFILDRLPRLAKAVLDAGGNGAALAQFARQKFGPERVEELKFSSEWYRVNMPPIKVALEGHSLLIPKDPDIIADFGLIELVDGVAKVPANARTKGPDGKPRHGDSAVATCLFHYASQFEVGEYGYRAIKGSKAGKTTNDNDDDRPHGRRFKKRRNR